jgi:hypothetical protein
MNKLLRVLTAIDKDQFGPIASEMDRPLADGKKPGVQVGYGHDIREASDGNTLHFKAGSTTGYTAVILWRDEPKLGMVILANRGKYRTLMPLSDRLMETITKQITRGRHR